MACPLYSQGRVVSASVIVATGRSGIRELGAAEFRELAGDEFVEAVAVAHVELAVLVVHLDDAAAPRSGSIVALQPESQHETDLENLRLIHGCDLLGHGRSLDHGSRHALFDAS